MSEQPHNFRPVRFVKFSVIGVVIGGAMTSLLFMPVGTKTAIGALNGGLLGLLIAVVAAPRRK